MIKTISTPNKIEIVFPLIKRFCLKAKVPYKPGEMAHWLRQNVGNQLMRVVTTDKLDGLAVMYFMVDIMHPKLFVSQLIAETKETRKELSDYIVKTASENGLDTIAFNTYHKPEWMIERFEEIGYKFEHTQSVLEMRLEA